MEAKEVAPKMVAIEPFPLEDATLLQKTEQSKDAEMKKQNRGKVLLIGALCNPWISVGDTVSFYRNAATNMTDEETGESYVVINENHILVKF